MGCSFVFTFAEAGADFDCTLPIEVSIDGEMISDLEFRADEPDFRRLGTSCNLNFSLPCVLFRVEASRDLSTAVPLASPLNGPDALRLRIESSTSEVGSRPFSWYAMCGVCGLPGCELPLEDGGREFS